MANTLLVLVVLWTQILEENIRKVKLSTPDYRGMNDDKAFEDFKQRRGTYNRVVDASNDLFLGSHVSQ